jgi:hypothetical protein
MTSEIEAVQGQSTHEVSAPAEFGEDCSGGVLEPRWSNVLCEKPVFPHVVSCDEIAPQKILLLEKTWAKAHKARRRY